MKKYQGSRTMDEVISFAKADGWEVDTTEFDEEGSDWIYLRDFYGQVKSNEGMPRQIAYNTTNGHFFVYEPLSEHAVANHMSQELDGEDWYTALLDMFYQPMEKI